VYTVMYDYSMWPYNLFMETGPSVFLKDWRLNWDYITKSLKTYYYTDQKPHVALPGAKYFNELLDGLE
jgi:hypothetical protein